MCDGDAVGVALGPSAYPSFPILPSLSPYHPIPYPTPLPTAVVQIGSFSGDPRLGAVRRFTPNPSPFPKQVGICAVRRRAAMFDESVDLAQYFRSLSLPMSLIRP